MTQKEIKDKIAKFEKVLAKTTSKDEKRLIENGIKKLKSQLEPEKKPAKKKTPVKKPTAKPKAKSVPVKKTVAKKPEVKRPKTEVKKKVSVKKLVPKFKTGDYVKDKKTGEIAKVVKSDKALIEEGFDYELDWINKEKGLAGIFHELLLVKTKKPIKKPAAKKKISVKKEIVKKAIKVQVKPKDLRIEKGVKKEVHKIATAFDKDIANAVLTLNKERYSIREIKDRKTRKVEKVKHSPEFKNVRTIKKRVDEIFNSSIFDIARTKKEKIEKKPLIDEINEIKDLTTLWLNEVDLLINNENKSDLVAIKKLMLGLIKEARKNDPDDKYKLSAGLKKIADKYEL